LVGGALAATGHQMRGGRWGLHVGDEALTVLNGWRRATIPWRDLEHFAIRPWGPARELQVRFRPGVLPPRGFSSGRPAGRGLHVPAGALTVLHGWPRAPIPWRALDHFALRPWRPARALQVRFRPEVLPPRGFSSGRPAGRGRPATDLTPLFQVSMLGDREAECVTTLAQHLPRRA